MRGSPDTEGTRYASGVAGSASRLQRNGQRPQEGGAKLIAQLSRRASPGGSTESGRSPTFFVEMTHSPKPTLQAEIEAQLATAEPDVEVVLAEVAGDTLRLFIDHPDGVTLALCERVTLGLASLRERYALEVSSPGTDRPLTKPQ